MREVIMRLIPEEFDEDYHAEILQDLVRCKDCYWWDRSRQLIETKPEFRNCLKLRMLTTEDWFCAEGRRKDETAL